MLIISKIFCTFAFVEISCQENCTITLLLEFECFMGNPINEPCCFRLLGIRELALSTTETSGLAWEIWVEDWLSWLIPLEITNRGLHFLWRQILRSGGQH